MKPREFDQLLIPDVWQPPDWVRELAESDDIIVADHANLIIYQWNNGGEIGRRYAYTAIQKLTEGADNNPVAAKALFITRTRNGFDRLLKDVLDPSHDPTFEN